jgi:deoxyribodipyrimidine photo-lyase
MSDLILFWHRRDLRISDHTGLAAARKKTPKIVGVFCLDPQILEVDDKIYDWLFTITSGKISASR